MSSATSFPLPPLPELANDELCQDLVQLDRQGRDIILRFHQHYFAAYADDLQTLLASLKERGIQLVKASNQKTPPEEIRSILNRLLQWAESLRHEQLNKTDENRRSALKALENDLQVLIEPLPAEKSIKISLDRLQAQENTNARSKVRLIGQRIKARLQGGAITRKVLYAALANYYLRQQLLRALEEILIDDTRLEKLFWEDISDALLLLERYLRVNILENDTDTDRLLEGLNTSFGKADKRLKEIKHKSEQRMLYLYRISTQKLAYLIESPDANRKIRQVHQQINALENHIKSVILYPASWKSDIQQAINTVYAQLLLLRLQNRMQLETSAWHMQHQKHITRWQNTLNQLSVGQYPLPEQMPGPASLQSQRQEIQLGLLEKIHKQPERMRLYPAELAPTQPDNEEGMHPESRFTGLSQQVQWARTLSYIVENQLFSPLRTEAALHDEKLSFYRQQVLDALSLLVFVADNKEAAAKKGEALEENINEVIDNGRKLLKSLTESAQNSINIALRQAVNTLSYEEVMEQAELLQKEWQQVQGTRLRSQFQDIALKSGKRAQQALARLLYSGSEGWLLARQVLHQPPGGINLARILHLRAEICPRQDVWEKLPPLYKNLFLHSSVIGQDFWVSRTKELAAFEQAITWHRQGQAGALIITGQPGMGKTALCRRALNNLAPTHNAYYITPPRTGSVSLKKWESALTEAIGVSLLSDLALNRLENNSVIVVPDLELWWERRAGGLDVIQELLRLIRQHGDRILFVFTVNTATLNMLEQLTEISEHALLILECQPLSARQLQNLILLRHRAGGLKLFWKNRPEDEISAFSLARLFSQLFTYSLGNPGLSLTGWLAAIDRVEDKNIYVDQIVQPDLSPLEDLPPNWQLWLSQFVLHRNLSSQRLAKLLPEKSQSATQILGHLQRAGFITAIQPDVFQLHDAMAPLVYRALLAKGILTGNL